MPGNLKRKLITQLQPDTDYSFVLMSRGNSAGGLQQQVSIRTAPDLLKMKPTQEQHDTEEGGRMTLSLPRVPAGASIRSVLFDRWIFFFSMEICLQFHRLYNTSHNTNSKTLTDSGTPKPRTTMTTVVFNLLMLELLHIEHIIYCKCGSIFLRAFPRDHIICTYRILLHFQSD